LNYFLEENNYNLPKDQSVKLEKIILAENEVLSLFYNDSFFTAVLERDTSSVVVAYSFEHGINKEQLEFQKNIFKALFINRNNQIFSVYSLKKTDEIQYGPYLHSLFGQTNCHNPNGGIINVSNLYTPQNVAVGCVAVSLTTVLHYYKWPNSDAGTKTYTDNLGSIKGTHTVNFDNEMNDWTTILDKYDYQTSTDEQRQALGKLAYNSAVALEMDFENGGSTSNVSKIPQALINYFKFYGEYKQNSGSSFFDLLDSMIIKNTVVPLAVSGNGSFHSIVCDGLKIDNSGHKYYHLNMGWWGSVNGWYMISSSFNAGGYSAIDGGVFNILPTPDLIINTEGNKFILNWQIPANIAYSGFEIQEKKGRQNWTTIADNLHEMHFETENSGTSGYAFRVRMKYKDFTDLVGWSNVQIYEMNTTAIEKQTQVNQVRVYPNPATNVIYIANSGYTNASDIKVFSQIGQQMAIKQTSENNLISLDIKELKPGIYFLSLMNGSSRTNKIFIKK
jgi:hypothetical protein